MKFNKKMDLSERLKCDRIWPPTKIFKNFETNLGRLIPIWRWKLRWNLSLGTKWICKVARSARSADCSAKLIWTDRFSKIAGFANSQFQQPTKKSFLVEKIEQKYKIAVIHTKSLIIIETKPFALLRNSIQNSSKQDYFVQNQTKWNQLLWRPIQSKFWAKSAKFPDFDRISAKLGKETLCFWGADAISVFLRFKRALLREEHLENRHEFFNSRKWEEIQRNSQKF